MRNEFYQLTIKDKIANYIPVSGICSTKASFCDNDWYTMKLVGSKNGRFGMGSCSTVWKMLQQKEYKILMLFSVDALIITNCNKKDMTNYQNFGF